MIEKKLVEKDVEVTVTEKRIVEVYHMDGKDYYDNDELRTAIAIKMASAFNAFLYHATDSCYLVWDTKVDTLKRNLRHHGNASKVFGSNKLDKLIDELKELKSVYSQVQD